MLELSPVRATSEPSSQDPPADFTTEATERFSLKPRDAAVVPATPSGLHRVIPQIPGYRIEAELGRGGMGVVYKARQLSLGRDVALKVLPGGAHRSPEDRQRFRREGTAAARLHHPNIVPIFDVGEHAGTAYLAMEYVEGGTLHGFQAGTPLLPRAAARILLTLATAVQHAHDHGIIHRDLKPANILLAASEAGMAEQATLELGFIPKIADFGLAKELGGPNLTEAGYVVGTPNYLAPEQMQAGQFGPRTDVYQLGILLFELLTGRLPFDAPSAAEVMMLIFNQEAPSPQRYVANVPIDLAVIAATCLRKDPNRRYFSAAALAADLQRFLAHEPILARPLGRVQLAVRWCRRNPAAAALGVVLALAAVGGVSLSAVVWRTTRDGADTLDQLEIQHAELRATQGKLAAENRRAEVNLRIARQATRATLLELANDPQLRTPKFFQLRKRLLDDARPIFEQFLTQATDDPPTLAEQADLCRQLGIMRAMLEDWDVAQERYAQAIMSYRRIAELQPGNDAALTDLADVLLRSSRVLRSQGKGAEGDENVDEAIGVLVGLVRRFPQSTACATQLARARLAFVHQTSGPDRVFLAGEQSRLALEMASEVLRLVPNDLTALNLYGRANRELGQSHARRGQLDAAECYFAEATQVREQLLALDPQDLEQRSDLAEILLQHSATRREGKACELLARAIALGESVCADAPQLGVYKARLVRYRESFAEAEKRR